MRRRKRIKPCGYRPSRYTFLDLTINVFRWDALPDPNEIPPKNETSLKDLLGEIRATVGQEAQIVQAVFPNPPFVMQVFLQRVFAQSVSTRCPLNFCAMGTNLINRVT